jgi:hypothetical protein
MMKGGRYAVPGRAIDAHAYDECALTCIRCRERRLRLHRPPWLEVAVGAASPVSVGDATWLYQCASVRVYSSVVLVLVLVRVLAEDCSPSHPPVALGAAESDEFEDDAEGTGAVPLPPSAANAEV